jgi:two-component system, OmpR family, sensor histidine kinase BaeS
MHSLFRRTLVAFGVSFVVLLGVLVVALVGGYRHSIDRWSHERMATVERAARQALTGQAGDSSRLPSDVPVFVYDAAGKLVASNRGAGRQRDTEDWERVQLRDGDRVIGSFEVGQAAFRNDSANRTLTDTLIRTAFAGALAAFASGMVTALLFARSLSRPAANVAAGIDAIARGGDGPPIPEDGSEEIARIAKAANTLATHLRDERALRAQWARDVTHDLRTPIASIRAQLEAVVDGVYEASTDRVRRLLDELARVQLLINDLDELMRLESPETTLNASPIDAQEFVDTIRCRLAPDAERRGLVLDAQVTAKSISGDEILLDRAVSNIVANAVRHAAEDTRIEIVVRGRSALTSCPRPAQDAAPFPALAQHDVEVTVRNQGDPIPAEELPHLFDRLYRGEYARTSPGSGLGLTIAKRIVGLHGGVIDITSSPEDGTLVRIALPAQSAS